MGKTKTKKKKKSSVLAIVYTNKAYILIVSFKVKTYTEV